METQPGFGPPDPIYLLLLVLVAGAVFAYWRKTVRDQRQRKAREHDARSHVVNDSNYNIARGGVDGHRTAGHDPAEAREVASKLKASGDMPTDEEFHELREDLKDS